MMPSALTVTLGASGHLFAIRRTIWTDPLTPLARPTEPLALQGIPALDHAKHLRGAARRIAENDPLLAKRTRIGRPDLPRTDDGLIDVNHAPAELLRHLPGLNQATAVQVRERVERLGPFQDLDEVILEVSAAPGFERNLRVCGAHSMRAAVLVVDPMVDVDGEGRPAGLPGTGSGRGGRDRGMAYWYLH